MGHADGCTPVPEDSSMKNVSVDDMPPLIGLWSCISMPGVPPCLSTADVFAVCGEV